MKKRKTALDNSRLPRWMILPPDGDWSEYTSRWTRKLCISDFLRDCQAPHREPPYEPTWADLERDGYRCMKVQIVPVGEANEEA